VDKETFKTIKDLVAVAVEPMQLVEMVEVVLQALVLAERVELVQQQIFQVLL
jgi:hypothetical protein